MQQLNLISGSSNNFNILNELPKELAFNILEYLPQGGSVGSCLLVCKRWKDLTLGMIGNAGNPFDSTFIKIVKSLNKIESDPSFFDVARPVLSSSENYPLFLLKAYKRNSNVVFSFNSEEIKEFCVQLKGPMDDETVENMSKVLSDRDALKRT